ncbi:hypothetical protein [Streptomyces marincola]|uniref:Uncharacterized protein n=1 Tax=Streptomyces marincola TaxID=2878388 RepID=A0A1W7CV14_9ACTN|nr:hypothetical protein [Streptomyces marincola]ARQ68664.1 hypothetical protein CAG99_07165 [Streptomyces marincola]
MDIRPFDGIDRHTAGPGVLLLPEPGGRRERDPSGLTTGTTWLYPARHGTAIVILEVPAWAVAAVAAVADPAPHPAPEKAVALAAESLLECVGRVAALVGEPGVRRREESDPFPQAVAERVAVAPGVVDTWLRPDFRYPDGTRPAVTRGSAAALLIAARRIALRAAVMLARSPHAAPAEHRARAGRAAGPGELVTEWCGEPAAEFRQRPVPVAVQAECQARLALRCAHLSAGG